MKVLTIYQLLTESTIRNFFSLFFHLVSQILLQSYGVLYNSLENHAILYKSRTKDSSAGFSPFLLESYVFYMVSENVHIPLRPMLFYMAPEPQITDSSQHSVHLYFYCDFLPFSTESLARGQLSYRTHCTISPSGRQDDLY